MEHPRVRAAFQARFTHIFVDEFQDTDPLQAEMLLLLSADNPAERYNAAGGQMDQVQSVAQARQVTETAYEGLYYVRAARTTMGLDPGPELPSLPGQGRAGAVSEDRTVDVDGYTDEPVQLRARIEITADGVAFDLTGSDPQRRAPVNSTYAQTFSACASAVPSLEDVDRL